MHDPASVSVYLFTDIEGSTRLWEREPARMQDALARHDAIARSSVTGHHGRVVKTTGDGIHAVFTDPADAVEAALALQLALADPAATAGITLSVRCGMHAGTDARRDDDFYGTDVNRAARVMSAAHGGQVLATQAIATLVGNRLPDGASLRPLGAVRLRDLARPEHVFQLVHPRLRQEFPALRSLEATPNNLPQQVTSFVGREKELAEVAQQLRQTRLLTLVGAGGLGKSRLSLQVAADTLDKYPDGAWFIELAPVADGRLVPQVVGSVLGVKEEAGRSVQDTLLRFVGDRRLLLVLDNCEHLLDACADLARRLLEAGPQVTILASSRERLNIAGERIYPLAPFAVPTPSRENTPDALARFASVRLFVERATAAQPGFGVSEDNAEAVASICHRLDGIPLALELAAARVRAMSVERIAERLTDRFRLLSSGDRTALPRQQTLRALIDWSYDLLEPAEQALFRRLSVFAGGFTLEAAEKVGAGEGIEEAEVLDLLTRLVEKSLVTLDVDRDRYGMLETVRQYADERLRDSDQAIPTRDRHLRFYHALCVQAGPQLFRENAGPWLARLDLERENVLAAISWCDHAENGGTIGLSVIRFIRPYFFIRGYLDAFYRAALHALARPGAQARDLARCRTLSDAGQFAQRMGQHKAALAHLEESLSIAREIDDRERVARALQPLGLTYLALGDTVMAERHLLEALELARAQGSKREIAAAMSSMEQLFRAGGDLDAAESMSTSVVALARELGDRESIGVGLLNLAMAAILRGQDQPAQAMLAEIVAINAEIGGATLGQGSLEIASGIAVVRGEFGKAARFYGAAERQAALSGLRRDPADEKFMSIQIGKMEAALGPHEFAATVLEGKHLPLEQAFVELRTWLDHSRPA